MQNGTFGFPIKAFVTVMGFLTVKIKTINAQIIGYFSRFEGIWM